MTFLDCPDSKPKYLHVYFKAIPRSTPNFAVGLFFGAGAYVI